MRNIYLLPPILYLRLMAMKRWLTLMNHNSGKLLIELNSFSAPLALKLLLWRDLQDPCSKPLPPAG